MESEKIRFIDSVGKRVYLYSFSLLWRSMWRIGLLVLAAKYSSRQVREKSQEQKKKKVRKCKNPWSAFFLSVNSLFYFHSEIFCSCPSFLIIYIYLLRAKHLSIFLGSLPNHAGALIPNANNTKVNVSAMLNPVSSAAATT